jgi:membrane protease YdiL (CAAX protease family)
MSSFPPLPPNAPDPRRFSDGAFTETPNPYAPPQPFGTPPTAPAPTPGGLRDTPDPGSWTARKAAWIWVPLAILVVMLAQQLGGSSTQPAPGAPVQVTAPQGGDQFAIVSGMMVKMANALKSISPGGTLEPRNAEQLTGQLTTSAVTPEDEFRALIVRAEIEGAGAVKQSVRDAEGVLSYEGASEDLQTLRAILDGQGVSDSERDRLMDRHGYFARLAFAIGLPDTDPARAPLVEGGGAIMAFVGVLIVFAVAVFIASITCFAILMMRLAQGKVRRRFAPPLPGGSVYMEMVGVFALGFFGLKLVMTLVLLLMSKGTGSGGSGGAVTAPSTELVIASMAGQWLLLAVLFYPLLRGVSWAEHKRRMGWHSGSGVFREIGAGLFAYFASLPLVFLAMLVTLLGAFVWSFIKQQVLKEPPETPSNPIFELLGMGSPVVLLVLFTMATVWAPLVEEGVFRGGCYRHLRSVMGVVLAGVLSAVAFGVMHGYPVIMLMPVITLGFIFSLMREWRGSLIAAITAHALHNATILSIAITGFWLLKPG